MKNIEIFVVSHKDLFLSIPENYKVIGVGEYGVNNKERILSDCIGDNISKKNPNYCELTAIYWLWKNYDLPNYVGVCHYRRFFVDGITSKIFETKKLERIMEEYDVILPKKVKEKPDVWSYFVNSISGKEKDLIILENLIKNDYKDYFQAFEDVMHSKSASFCNMAVMKKDDFDKYCKWLFELLEKYESRVDLSGYTKQEQRIYGFMSEFFLNYNYRIKKRGVIFLGFYVIYIMLFFFINVTDYQVSFLNTFLLLFPLLFLMFCVYSKKDVENLFKVYVNIMIVIASASLIFFCLGSLTNIIQTNVTKVIDWGKNTTINGYFYLHFNTQTTVMFSQTLLRNTSIFVEGPMFALHLMFAMSLSLFFRKKIINKYSIIFGISILSTLSVTGLLF